MLTNFLHFSSQLHQPPKDQISPIRSVDGPGREHVEGPQSVFLFGPEVVDLMGQLISDSLMQEGREQEVLHSVEGVGSVKTSFVVVLLPENILGPSSCRNGQGLGRRSLVYFRGDSDPSVVCLVHGREQGGARHLRGDRGEQGASQGPRSMWCCRRS